MLQEGEVRTEPFVNPPEAISEARRTQADWAGRSLRERLQVVRRFRHLLAANPSGLAQTAMQNGTRPSAEVLASEVLPLADACRFLEREAGAVLSARRLGSRGRPLWLFGVQAEVRREPHGVVLLIAPANYPLFLPGVQLLQALVAGNAVLLKPGMEGTSAALALARLLQAAGLPPGLLQVLPEAPEAAQAAIGIGVDKVLFTGSAAIGTQVLAQLAARAVPATMELSGCDAVFVRADADLGLVVRALAFGLRLNAGQTCIAPRRVFVARAIATEFEGRLAQVIAQGRRVTLAPDRTRRLLPFLRESVSAGAHFLAGEVHADGSISSPLILAGVSPSSALLQEDFFAPVMSVVTASNDEEALGFAANCPYALGASIFSRDLSAARAVARRLSAGAVVINDMIVPTADARLPFGGRGPSGFGVTRGHEGLLEMTRVKVVALRAHGGHRHLEPHTEWDAGLFSAYLAAAHGLGLQLRCGAGLRLLGNLVRRGRKTGTEEIE